MILEILYGCNAQYPTNILIVERKSMKNAQYQIYSDIF